MLERDTVAPLMAVAAGRVGAGDVTYVNSYRCLLSSSLAKRINTGRETRNSVLYSLMNWGHDPLKK